MMGESNDAARQPLRHRGWMVLGLALLVALTSYWCIRGARQTARSLDNDFGVYYLAGKAALESATIYRLDRGELLTFKYAPVVAAICSPLSLLDPVTARVVWCLIDLACLAACLWLTVRMTWHGDARRGWILAIIVAALVTGHIVAQLHCSQSTSVWLLLTLVSYRCLTRNRLVLSGASMALAVCIKCVPLAFVPMYLMSRRWRPGLLWFGASLLLLCFSPALLWGWSNNLEMLQAWPAHLARTSSVYQITRPENQSVLAQLARWFQEPGGALIVPLASLQRAWAVIAIASAIVVHWFIALVLIRNVGGTDRTVRQRERTGSEASMNSRADVLPLVLLLIYVTIMNPLAWRYNFLALMMPYAYVAASLLRSGPDVRWLLLLVSSAMSTVPLPEAVFLSGGRLWGTALLTVLVFWTWRREATLGTSISSWEKRFSGPPAQAASEMVACK